MRLLNVDTKELREFQDDNDLPAYVIASHRWTNEEITMNDWQNQENTEKFGFQKVVRFCGFVRDWAAELDLHWLWIDTVCIDKRDPNGVQEAINSMFKYYQQACVCLAFLHDVMPLSCEPTRILQSFEQSIWFKRGWTLQELLAPEMVLFLNQDWEVFGHKASTKPPGILSTRGMNRKALNGHEIKLPLNHVISSITGIQKTVLDDYSASKKLDIKTKKEWMKDRTTSRTEDRAYALLGICDVHLPLIYGEGRKAMNRLEDAIKAAHENQGRAKKPISGHLNKPGTIDFNYPTIDSQPFPGFPDPFAGMSDPVFGGIADPFAHLGVGQSSHSHHAITPALPPPPGPPGSNQTDSEDQFGNFVDTFLKSVKSCGFAKYDFIFEACHPSHGSTLVTRKYDRQALTSPYPANSFGHIPFRPNQDQQMHNLQYLPRKKISEYRQRHRRSPQQHRRNDEYLSSSFAASETDAYIDDISTRPYKVEASRHARPKPMPIESQRVPEQRRKPSRHSVTSANRERKPYSKAEPLAARQHYLEDCSEDSCQDIQLTPESFSLQNLPHQQENDTRLSTKDKLKKTILEDILEKNHEDTSKSIGRSTQKNESSQQQGDSIFIPGPRRDMRRS